MMRFRSRPGLIGLAWRALFVGLTYLVLLIVTGGFAVRLGFEPPASRSGFALIPWLFLSGIIIGLTIGPIAAQIAAPVGRHLGIWTPLLFLNSAAALIEGVVFAPGLISATSIPFVVFQQLLTLFGTAILITWIFRQPNGPARTTEPLFHAWQRWWWGIAITVFSYVALFFLVGRVNYALFTRRYYEQLGGLVTPPFLDVLWVETLRGILIVASILPFLRTLQADLRRKMVLSGILLFVAGGVIPLMLQVHELPPFLLLASSWEILLQLFPTGIIAAALIGKTR